MLNTVGRFIYIKYLGICYVEHCGKIDLINKLLWILYVEHCGKIYLHKILGEYFMLKIVGRFLSTNYWGILYVEHCGEIYLHKIVRNTLCWTQWEDLFTYNTWKYVVLNTVRRFIYTKYWEIRYVDHCGNIYLHKILGITLCWTLWEDIFTQNTEEYCMLSTMGRFI